MVICGLLTNKEHHMPKAVNVNVNGSWRLVHDMHVKLGGSWRKITEGYVNIGGTWHLFYGGTETPTGWGFVTTGTFTSSDIQNGDRFGFATAMPDEPNAPTPLDPQRVLVSAYFEDAAGTNTGAVYVFEYTGGTSVSQIQKLTPQSPTNGDYFGISVAISGDGSTIAIGSSQGGVFSQNGYVEIHTWNGSSYTHQQTLTVTTSGIQFGQDVALSYYGDTLVASSVSGGAFIFTRSGSTWTQQDTINGSSVSISGGGRKVLSSASGNVYVYDFDGSSASSSQTIGVTNVSDVALSKDGTAFIAGQEASDQAVVYKHNGSSFSLDQTLTASDGTSGDQFGYAVAINGNGSAVFVGAPSKTSGAGASYVFVESGGSLLEEQILDGPSGSFEGISLSTNQNGSRLLHGAYLDSFGGVGAAGAARISY